MPPRPNYNMATANNTPTYRVLRVPRSSPRLAELVSKSRTARLHALETDPTSFLARHATESALPLSVWEKRLTDPEIVIVVCVATHTNSSSSNDSSSTTKSSDGADKALEGANVAVRDDESTLIEGEWVGVAAVRGPMAYGDYYVTSDMGLPIPDRPNEEARWHLFDLYTLPQHRGRGLARKLVAECVRIAVEGTGTPALLREPAEALSVSHGAVSHSSDLHVNALNVGDKKARIRLFMNPKNAWLFTMYERLGFRAAGKVTLEEGFRANRLDDSIPEDTRVNEEMERLWHTRFGVAMEQVVGVRAASED